MKNKRVDAKISCVVCLGEIINGKHEAIFCDGQCKKWYHRGCASMSQELLASPGDNPFYCLLCSQALFKQQVSQLLAEIDCLKAELKVVPVMQASIETLKKEVADLRGRLSTAKDRDCCPPTRSYAKAAASKVSHLKHHSNPKPVKTLNTAASTSNVQTQERSPVAMQATNSADHCIKASSEAKTKVLGARRVWGTMRSATTYAVTSTLKKLTSVGNKLSVKRKSRPGNNSGKSAYWFVIKSSEDVLKQEWDQVQLQIGWRLEDCYKKTKYCHSSSTDHL